jgi:uracil-DNA glycosylase family 4
MVNYPNMPPAPELQKRQRALAKIARQLQQAPCPLRKTATQAVPGEGSPMAKLFFIGEAPGRQEDETGRPFVGAAGKMLNELLSSIGLKREDIFVTSIEKFRPPNNRDPKPKEILACFPYLEAQIKVIKPAIIVTLGRHALRRMLEWEKGQVIEDTISMDKLHGRLFRGPSGRLYFPIHHPAAILYQRSLKDVVQKDFRKLGKFLNAR